MAKIQGIKKLGKLNLSSTYILLISPEYIPHLALVTKGKYFSLTHKKAFMNESFDPYFKFLRRSKRKMLFIELEGDLLDPEDVFSRYEKASVGSTTCLLPVRECVLPRSKAGFIFELVPDLYEGGKIKGAYQVNMDDDINDLGEFNLTVYDKEAIFSYIESLNEKYAKRG